MAENAIPNDTEYHEAVRRFEECTSITATKGWMQLCAQHLTDDGTFVVWTNFLGGKPIAMWLTSWVCTTMGIMYGPS